MARTLTPLRYPGGKSSIFEMVSSIIQQNELVGCHYAEPYAGGGGLALALLLKKVVKEIHLNDLDLSIWAFWNAMLNETDRFIHKIEKTVISIDEWHKQRKIQTDVNNADLFDLGFSTFFLNRTNRSGIISKAGVIGGLKQNSKYKLDCRFNKADLIKKISEISNFKNSIHIYNLDAVDFIKRTNELLPNKSFYCIDPPYYEKGSTLYRNFYQPKDHEELAQVIFYIKHSWILTYDITVPIQKLYKDSRQFIYNLNYSLNQKKVGTELLIVDNHLKVPKNFLSDSPKYL